jgi:Recombinase zinc beta ribbon domain/Recombinase
MGVPGADRLLERAAVVGQELDSRSGTGGARTTRIQGVRDWPVHEGTAAQARQNLGLTNRRGKPLTSQVIGVLLRNQIYAGIINVPEYGVRGKRGDFEPLISEDLFYQVQAVLSGRTSNTAPRQRAHPDFPLRGFVRCESCGRGLTSSWSRGRSEYYAYYHCRPGRRALNVSKAKLEGLFADELALLQPTPGYMRLLKESVLQIWKARKVAVREELTLVRIERHSGQLDELDVEGILAFAERVLSRAADLWVRRHSNSGSGSNNCSFPTESRLTEIALFEPA